MVSEIPIGTIPCALSRHIYNDELPTFSPPSYLETTRFLAWSFFQMEVVLEDSSTLLSDRVSDPRTKTSSFHDIFQGTSLIDNLASEQIYPAAN